MQTVFWEPEIDQSKNEDLEAAMNNLIKRTAVWYLLITLSTLLMFLYVPLLSDEDKLIFEAYRIPALGYLGNLGIQAYVGFTHIVYGIFPFDMIFMILVTCTTVQFKMLNEELRSLFDRDLRSEVSNDKFRERFNRCIKHYDFLLQ
ncbi:unnamed protein product [Acanthoscelides obtectus]|uniref:Uncharacterized protein n=1 Tax=Acanthoscelides obtectus TaxID=200917 RepID=A0A9P0PHU0_ACAOB|nr:unnamed protein product [Acanthoscelides obtectus]CAK1676630.1 hypothetical protein AOBTE_LOCUS30870 [Acanthoscelides obtectus]